MSIVSPTCIGIERFGRSGRWGHPRTIGLCPSSCEVLRRTWDSPRACVVEGADASDDENFLAGVGAGMHDLRLQSSGHCRSGTASRRACEFYKQASPLVAIRRQKRIYTTESRRQSGARNQAPAHTNRVHQMYYQCLIAQTALDEVVLKAYL